MRFEEFSFGSIRIDGVSYDHDVVIDRGEVRKRKKKPPRGSVKLSDTHRYRWKKKYRGNAVAWWSVPATVPCQ
jgi:hypothetical protein